MQNGVFRILISRISNVENRSKHLNQQTFFVYLASESDESTAAAGAMSVIINIRRAKLRDFIICV
jgi:hypothetical protein